jgi:hypothetical protein
VVDAIRNSSEPELYGRGMRTCRWMALADRIEIGSLLLLLSTLIHRQGCRPLAASRDARDRGAELSEVCSFVACTQTK